MNTTKLREKVKFAGLMLIILQLLALIIVWTKCDVANSFFYIILTYFAMRNLLYEKPHQVCAVLWSMMTLLAVLGLIFGGIAVVLYWWMYSIHAKYTTPTTTGHPKAKHGARQTTKTEITQTAGIIQCFGRIPFVRLPIPWLKYTLDLDHGVLTRDNFFPEKHDKDDSRHDFLGKDDDLLLKQVFDWSFSTKLWRRVAGTSCFEFQSKKIGRTGDKKNHWHCLPNGMVESLRHKLIEVN